MKPRVKKATDGLTCGDSQDQDPVNLDNGEAERKNSEETREDTAAEEK